MTFRDYKTALVTGSSSGIGAATVRRLRSNGIAVHAIARDKARLDALAAETGCIPHALDICDAAKVDATLAGLDIDILINNAGQSRPGDILDTTRDDIDSLIDVNLRAVLHLTHALVPGMVARNCGHVVNISSIAGHYAFAGGNTVYHATKAGIHALSIQLRTHLYGTSVRVTEISPARVETEVFARVLGDAAEAQRRFFDGYEALQPEDIADSIAFAIAAPARMNVSFMEVLPTKQVVGGLNFARNATAAE